MFELFAATRHSAEAHRAASAPALAGLELPKPLAHFPLEASSEVDGAYALSVPPTAGVGGILVVRDDDMGKNVLQCIKVRTCPANITETLHKFVPPKNLHQRYASQQ